jgi:hypothetical protein
MDSVVEAEWINQRFEFVRVCKDADRGSDKYYAEFIGKETEVVSKLREMCD